MDKALTVPKWVLIFQSKIPQVPQNLSARFVCPSSKVLDFNGKKLHWASVVRASETRTFCNFVSQRDMKNEHQCTIRNWHCCIGMENNHHNGIKVFKRSTGFYNFIIQPNALQQIYSMKSNIKDKINAKFLAPK